MLKFGKHKDKPLSEVPKDYLLKIMRLSGDPSLVGELHKAYFDNTLEDVHGDIRDQLKYHSQLYPKFNQDRFLKWILELNEAQLRFVSFKGVARSSELRRLMGRFDVDEESLARWDDDGGRPSVAIQES